MARKLAYGAVLAITAAVLANLGAAGASASTASRHHAIPVVVLGKWKYYKHKHHAAPAVEKVPMHCPTSNESQIDVSRYVFI
jgi:hypothetical protein